MRFSARRFGNNLDWAIITSATQVDNLPWGEMADGMACTADTTTPYTFLCATAVPGSKPIVFSRCGTGVGCAGGVCGAA